MRVFTYLLLPFLSDATNGAGTCVTCTVVATWLGKLKMHFYDGYREIMVDLCIKILTERPNGCTCE